MSWIFDLGFATLSPAAAIMNCQDQIRNLQERIVVLERLLVITLEKLDNKTANEQLQSLPSAPPSDAELNK